MDGNASFGYWVRRRRRALDLTQDELARRVGCSVITIRKIEADARRPSAQVAARLAEQLNIAPADRTAFIKVARAALSADRVGPTIRLDDMPAGERAPQRDRPAPRRGEPAALPHGTVTLLFTDIEGSTRLLQLLGERYVGMLADHQRLLRAAFGAWNGREVSTWGDAFFVAFERASDAVAAAVAAQRALAAHTWPAGVPLRVRMGLHTGEPTLAGGEYIGLDVHRAARLCAAGHGGQVLLSQTARDLAEHALPEGVQLYDLGAHRFKDLQRPERVSQLVIPELSADFPPLMSERLPGGAPAPRFRLIGRE